MAISITFDKNVYIIDSGGPILRYPAGSVEITTNGDDVIMSPTGSDSRRAKILRAPYTDFVSPSGASAEDVAAAIFALNVGVDVNIQNQTTPPIDLLFVESLSNFTLLTDTGVSGITTMVYVFTATPGHGIVIGNEIILLDPLSDISLQATIIDVIGDVITIDRPIDNIYTAATTLGRVTNSNMNVVGSLAAPRIFSISGGLNPSDYTRFLLTMSDNMPMDDGQFGGIPALTNGLVFRVISDYQRTVFNFKTNQDINQFCFDTRYASKAPSGLFGFSGRITFNGPDKHGVPLRIAGLQVIQWIVQDDLSDLLSIRVAGQGQETIGEV